MADVGEVLQRFLDPRWDTVTGTLREWMDLEYRFGAGSPGPSSMGPSSMGPSSMGPGSGEIGVAVVYSVGSGSSVDPTRPPTEMESWKRLWVRRDGRSRVEHRQPGVDAPYLTEIHDPEGVTTIAPDGSARRGEAHLSPTPPTWLLDAGSLLGLLRLSFGQDDEFAGRPVLHAAATMRRELPPMARSAGPMLYGMPIGGRSELTIDVETGILVRFATFEGNRLIGLRQFVELAVDRPVEDELVTYRLRPGQRLRTHRDDLLDMLRAEGEDVAGIDPDDEAAVQEAMARFHERRRSFFGYPPDRPLVERVDPVGPPPPDEAEARVAIADAVAGLSPADPEPRSTWIERGELLEEAFARSRENTAHSTRGITVTIALSDLVFVDQDEAVIEFGITFGTGRTVREGRAVRRRERWVVSYDTAAALLQLGGVQVPPLADQPPEAPLT